MIEPPDTRPSPTYNLQQSPGSSDNEVTGEKTKKQKETFTASKPSPNPLPSQLAEAAALS